MAIYFNDIGNYELRTSRHERVHTNLTSLWHPTLFPSARVSVSSVVDVWDVAAVQVVLVFDEFSEQLFCFCQGGA